MMQGITSAPLYALHAKMSAFQAADHDYQLNNAWTWEHQALINARLITGNVNMSKRFERIRCNILSQPRVKARLQQEVVDMREQTHKEHPRADPDIIINDHVAHILKIAYLTFRSVVHQLSLQEKPALVPEKQFRGMRKNVVQIWKDVMEIK